MTACPHVHQRRQSRRKQPQQLQPQRRRRRRTSRMSATATAATCSLAALLLLSPSLATSVAAAAPSDGGIDCQSANSKCQMTQSQINLQRPKGKSTIIDEAVPVAGASVTSKPRGVRKLFHGNNSKNEPARLIHDFTRYQSSHRLLGGAFNPALENYNAQGDPTNGVGGVGALGIVDNDLAIAAFGAPSTFIQCPPAFEGNRASYDCTSYVQCSQGQIRGQFHSCMGLLFDNVREVCDWEESVDCEGHVVVSSSGDDGDVDGDVDGDGGNGGTSSDTSEKVMASAISSANNRGENGENADAAAGAWSGGSDWGGAWIAGVWVPDGEQAKSPGQSPSGSSIDPSTITWDTAQIVPYPPHPVLPFEESAAAAATSGTETTSTKVPSEYTSAEGWSYQTRDSKKVIGYYASWQWYDKSERAKPMNMNFQKVDRVNFAFFQTDVDGNLWGTDEWADPITLFGPHDWMIDVIPGAGYAPQFTDDNGFDDSTGAEYNYVGNKYVDLGPNIHCHRSTPNGERDCLGHKTSEGLIDRAHSQGAHVFPSIGGWSLSDPFPKLAKSAKSRRNFAKNCVGLIREYGFDGIDIDWEYPTYEPHQGTPADTNNFILLLKDIRAALDAYQAVAYPNGEKTFGLTAALPCGPPIIDSQDVNGISSILTEMNLMTYDFHGTWDEKAGVNAPLYDQDPNKFESPEYSVDGCVERWVREGADRSRINIGLPFYGRSFGRATKLYGEHDGADGVHWWSDEGMPQYYNILDKLPEMISLRDDITKTQYAYFDDDTGGLISYDDQQAICDKVDYARKKNLNGYIIWELSGDLTEELSTPLLDVVNFKLEQGDSFECELFRAESRGENGEVISQDNAGPQLWYASWESGSCVNDGKQPAWIKEEDLFRFKEECCGYKFEYKFDDCVGPPTKAPTDQPSPFPTASPIIVPSASPSTLSPTHVFGAAQIIISGGPAITTSRVAEGADENAASNGPAPPVTWCFNGCRASYEKCVGNENHPQAIDDDTCKACLTGQTFWPCDVDGLCFCWDPDTPRIPPAPSSGLAMLTDERPCDYFTESIYMQLAPEAKFPYTYKGLCDAIDHYNDGHAEKIFMMGSDDEKKREFAMFLGHTLHESDEWKASREYLICADTKEVGGEVYCKPCTGDEFDWDNFMCDGVGLAGGGLTFNGYCNSVIEPPLACPCEDTLVSEPAPLEGYLPASKIYFGRGAIQLSWNYNYRAASAALTGDGMTFCDDPDLVATTPEYAWGAGVFFWMENLKEETTCHIEALAHHDFGGTLNNINGGLECPAYHGGWHGEAIKLRLNRYCKASEFLGLSSISSFDGCKGLSDSFAECLSDGTCPYCAQFSDVSVGNTTTTDGTTSETDESLSVATSVTPPDETDESLSVATSVTPPDEDEVEDFQTQDQSFTTTTLPKITTGGTSTIAATTTTSTAASTTAASTTTSITASTNAATTTISASICPEGLFPVEGLDGCCLPEPAYLGDGACDPDAPYNTLECNYDGGDCCKETCDLGSTYGCSGNSQGYGPFGYYCLDPEHSNINPEKCTVLDRTRIGDGRCDSQEELYNTEACGWDGGDCCEDTCQAIYAYFECGVPSYDCKNSENDAVDSIISPPETSSPETKSPNPMPTKLPTSAPVDVMPVLARVFVGVSEDSTIARNDPDSNFGLEPTLKLKGPASGPDAHDSIMRFVIPASEFSSSTPVAAVLRVYSLKDSDSGGIFHLAPETSPWSEESATWNNAPDWNTRLDNLGSVEKDNWYTIDVSQAIDSLGGEEGTMTIRVRSRDPGFSEYSSKEGSFPPEIMVIYYGEPDNEGDSGVQVEYSADPNPIDSTNLSEGKTCDDGVRMCPDGSFVEQVAENGCQFATCPDSSGISSGKFYPVWGAGGAGGCVDATPPSWVTGAYLKDSKSECCDAYFMLQASECLNA